ncbi:hypothetical protein [Micromonospora sp. I033]
MSTHEKLAPDGRVHDATTETLLRDLLEALAAEIRVTRLAAASA